MSDNIVDLSAFRKKKKGQAPDPMTPITAVISDRSHINLYDDGTLEFFTGAAVDRRPASREEMALMRHAQFLEARVATLLEEYVPHMLYDDYVTTPFIDWKEVTDRQGEMAQEWNRTYQDHPEIILSRRVHLMIEAARKRMHHIAFTNRLGLAVSDEIKHGKILKARNSPMMVFIAGPGDLEENMIRASFKAIHPSKRLGATTQGTFEFVFADNNARAAFIARLMSFANMEQVRHYLTEIQSSLGNGKVEFN